MDTLVKVSGSLVSDEDFYKWLLPISKQTDNLFIVCGGGAAISSVLEKVGIPYIFGPAGREIGSESGIIIARDVLEASRNRVHRELQHRGIRARVYIPVVYMGGKICHLNGDDYVVALYPNFDQIYVVTRSERKKRFPKECGRIKVVKLS